MKREWGKGRGIENKTEGEGGRIDEDGWERRTYLREDREEDTGIV